MQKVKVREHGVPQVPIHVCTLQGVVYLEDRSSGTAKFCLLFICLLIIAGDVRVCFGYTYPLLQFSHPEWGKGGKQ